MFLGPCDHPGFVIRVPTTVVAEVVESPIGSTDLDVSKALVIRRPFAQCGPIGPGSVPSPVPSAPVPSGSPQTP